MPWHNLNVLAQIDSGAIGVIYGSSAGLSATGSQVWHQDSPDIEDDSEGSDFFGISLAAANFGKGSQADLAVGVPNEDLGANTDAGAVNVIYGTTNGLMATDDQFWHQGP
jgi:hypothetical protein